MKPVLSFLIMLALAATAGCTSPIGRVDGPPPARLWKDTGTPPNSVVLERQPRYYVDEHGSV